MSREYAPTPGKWYENKEEEETFRVLSVDEDEELVGQGQPQVGGCVRPQRRQRVLE